MVMKQAVGSTRQSVRAAAGGARGIVMAVCRLLPVGCLLAGCASFGPMRNPATNPIGEVLDWKPEPVKVVNYVNANAALINTIECHDVDIDIKVGTQAIGVSAELHCQKPRNSRLRAKTLGKDAADIGSNPQE